MKVILPKSVAPTVGPLSPLEEGLRGPNAAQLRDKTLVQIKDLAQRTQSELRIGGSSAKHEQLTALLDASLAAQEILEKYAVAVSQSAMPKPARIG